MKAVKAEEVKKFLRKREIDFVGIAPVERFVHAPIGRRPADLLPEAKSVIVLGVHILTAVGRAANLAHYRRPEMRHAGFIHMLFGYVHLNRVMDTASHELAREMERKGYVTLPIPASAPNDSKALYGAFSNRHAAVAAGFGELGWHGLLLTPQYGSRVRLASIITEAELEPDPMYSGKPLCDPKRLDCDFSCIKLCPVNAFVESETLSAVIGGREFTYAKVHKRRCTLRDFEQYPPGSEPVEIPHDITDEEWLDLVRKYGNPWHAQEQAAIGRGSRGCRCQYECPIGGKLPT